MDYDEKEYDDFDKRELTILGRWFWFTVIAVVATFLYSVGAYAAPLFKIPSPDGKTDTLIRLHDSECTDKAVLEYLYDNVLDAKRFKKADLLWDGEPFGACYIELNGNVHPIGSDKQPIRPPIPRGLFQEEGV